MPKKKPYTLYIYWEDEVKLNTHHQVKLKFNTTKEAVMYAKELLDPKTYDWTVFDENGEIVADKGEYL